MSNINNGNVWPSTSTVANSASNYIDSLLSGIKWGGGSGTGTSLTFSFPWSASSSAYWATNPNYSDSNEPSSAFALSPSEQAAARATLATWSNVANISFSEIIESSSDVGTIRVAWTTKTLPNAAAWAFYPNNYWASGGDVWLSQAGSGGKPSSYWNPGQHGFFTLFHEWGHALGLKHPFEDYPVLAGAENSTQYTAMSQTDHPHSLFVQVTSNPSGSVSWSSFKVQPDTPMLYDVAAIQYLYGANQSYRTGNDVYTFDPSTPFFRTIWDAGGNDTISVSNFTKGSIIDLRPGYFSKITIESDSTAGYNWISAPPQATYNGTDNLAIAYGTVIENAIGGSGNDTITGNDANNTISGGAGNDTMDGGAGIDVAAFGVVRANYVITRAGATITVKCNSGNDGTDTLVSVERLKFSDFSVALDISGNAGTTAKILGAVFGKAAVANKEYAGIGLSLLDGGMSYLNLMQLAINAKLGASASNEAVVNLLYTNVVGTPPPVGDLAFFQGWLDSGAYTKASLGMLAADTALNTVNVNLIGLANNGLEYLPWG